jgi:hypothetical protein
MWRRCIRSLEIVQSNESGDSRWIKHLGSLTGDAESFRHDNFEPGHHIGFFTKQPNFNRSRRHRTDDDGYGRSRE